MLHAPLVSRGTVHLPIRVQCAAFPSNLTELALALCCAYLPSDFVFLRLNSMHSRSNKVQMEIGRNDPKNTKNRALDVEKPTAGGNF